MNERKKLEGNMVVQPSHWAKLLLEENERNTETLKRANEKHEDSGAWGSIVEEMFADAYGIGNDRTDSPHQYTPWGQEVFKRIRELPEWQRVIQHTQGDDVYAAHVAGQVAEAIAPYITPPEQHEPPAPPPPPQGEGEQGEGDEGDEQGEGQGSQGEGEEQGQGDGAGEGEGQGEGQGQSQGAGGDGDSQGDDGESGDASDGAGGTGAGKGDSRTKYKGGKPPQLKGLPSKRSTDGHYLKQAMEYTLQEAEQRIENANQMTELMEHFSSGAGLTKKELRDVKRSLVSFHGVEKLAKLVGRMRESARQAQREKQKGPTSISSVELGGDLTRMLPSEAVNLLDPIRGPQQFGKMLDHAALQYEVTNVSEGEKGPIVFCLDTSGSMGSTAHYAKSFMLGMMEVAKKQKRAFAVVEFDHHVHTVTKFKKPGKPDVSAIARIAGRHPSGGTNIGRAIDAARLVVMSDKAFGKADIVVLTDGCDDSTRWELEIAKCHKQKTSIYYVGFGVALHAKVQKALDQYVIVTHEDIQKESLDPFKSLFGI